MTDQRGRSLPTEPVSHTVQEAGPLDAQAIEHIVGVGLDEDGPVGKNYGRHREVAARQRPPRGEPEAQDAR